MKIMRAWNGRLNNLNAFANYLDENDILNKGESNEKAKIFHQYYRFYNDGDYPRGYKFAAYTKAQEYLEDRLEKFMKKIVKKYMSAEIRTAVREKRLADTIETITSYTGTDTTSPHMIMAFAKRLPYSIRMEIGDAMVAMNVRSRDLDLITKSACDNYEWEESYHNPSNTVMLYKRAKMKEVGIWDKMMEETLVAVIGECAKIEFMLKNHLN